MGELPFLCQIACPLRDVDFERYGIVPSPDCMGPKIAEKSTSDRVIIDPEGDVELEAFGGDGLGELVCRNVGVSESIDKLVN